ncbi:RDD family protein [Aquidulcibacter sp.]|uniref:RDD family protein n=1 Tax=Aquidulcibacter sp. TaxID=2052990 RepID=UPI0028AD8591|nr:RDD family protein [Aquidulcibacter sp.]
MSETDQWFYKIGEADLGPVSEADLINLYRDGHISDETHVRLQGQETEKQIAEAFPQIGETPPTSSEEDTWCDTSPHPWRRFFARSFDLNMNTIVLILGWTFLMTAMSPDQPAFWTRLFVDREYTIPSALLTTAFSFLGNIPLMAYGGTTLGKWIFGIRIVQEDGRPIGLKKAIKRELAVFLRAYFLMIPIANLFTLAGAYETLTSEGKTSWDRDYALVAKHRPNSTIQTLVHTMTVILLVAGVIWLILPPASALAP